MRRKLSTIAISNANGSGQSCHPGMLHPSMRHVQTSHPSIFKIATHQMRDKFQTPIPFGSLKQSPNAIVSLHVQSTIPSTSPFHSPSHLAYSAYSYLGGYPAASHSEQPTSALAFSPSTDSGPSVEPDAGIELSDY
jgi:hypothetical protein